MCKSQLLYAVLNRNVFVWLLNVDSQVVDLISDGREFHNLGAAIENALSPILLADSGWNKRHWSEERRVRGGL